MPELTSSDLENYTKGRLLASNPETGRILYRALSSARTFCGWHVTPPIKGDHKILNGPGSRILMLPTMFLSQLNSIAEDGAALNIDDLHIWAADSFAKSPILVRKRSGACWSNHYASIEVDMDHGFTEDDAQDWRQAVLDMCDRASLKIGQAGAGPLIRERVDDTERAWASGGGVEGLQVNPMLLGPYRLMAPV